MVHNPVIGSLYLVSLRWIDSTDIMNVPSRCTRILPNGMAEIKMIYDTEGRMPRNVPFNNLYDIKYEETRDGS